MFAVEQLELSQKNWDEAMVPQKMRRHSTAVSA
jgi:hypothetical protein